MPADLSDTDVSANAPIQSGCSDPIETDLVYLSVEFCSESKRQSYLLLRMTTEEIGFELDCVSATNVFSIPSRSILPMSQEK